MSTSAFAHGVNTAAALGGISILPKTIFHDGTGIQRTAGLVFQTNGTVNWRRTNTFVQLNPLTDWIIPNSAASSVYQIRLTNLVWITKDEGFLISPSGGTWPGGGGADSDGDEDTWFDMSVAREWTFIDTAGSGVGVGVQHATFDIQMRRGTGPVLVTAAMDWYVDSHSGGGGGCFILGTQFRMADGSLKEVQEIMPGDIMEAGGKVHQAIVGDGTEEEWYDVEGVVVTGTHAVCKDGVWMRVRDAGYNQVEGANLYYCVANDNHRMVAANGQTFSDFDEADYMTVNFGDWLIDSLNGKVSDSPLEISRENLRPQSTTRSVPQPSQIL